MYVLARARTKRSGLARRINIAVATWCSLSENLFSYAYQHQLQHPKKNRKSQATHTRAGMYYAEESIHKLLPQLVKLPERDHALDDKLVRIHQEALAVKGSCLLRTCQGQRL